MILKALEMQGFKSFPDKTILNFGAGMTSVVGPNGSGKSNISDAVRWVLGEQSTKNLRGSKMEDVIFGGTSVRKAQGYAEVTLKLDNKDRTLEKNADDITVTRRYYRSGESEYTINGETVRLKDVHELFMDTGLGRDGYSLVSQGKIADLISSKSDERRDMFEEAAGISHFRYRRSDALRRLSQAQENLVRLRDILSELEVRVGPLKEQSEKAEKFLVLSEQKKELEIGLWLHTLSKSKESLREQEHKISLADNQYNDAEQELQKIEDEIEQIIEKTQNITVNIDEIRHNASGFEEQAAQIDSQIAVAKNTIELNEQAIARINKDMEQTSGTKQRIDDQINDALKQIEELTAHIEMKNGELQNLSGSMDSLLKENEQNADKASELSSTLSKLSLSLADSRVEQSTAKSSIDEITVRITAIDDTLSGRNDLTEKLQEEKDRVAGNLNNIIEKINEFSNAINGYEMRVNSRTQKEEKIKAELDAINLEVQQKSSRAKMLEDLEKNMEGYSGSVKAVMRESKNGALRGIHGPLSQLINVKDKYSAAIETALGAAVQNIVVDNENDAKRAINYLKETKAGRATFLPISTIKGSSLQEKGLDDCFGFVNIASELVQYDSKYKEIICSQLARTAVVEDMDSAIAIAKKYNNRFRIVTLDGQVINAGGSMTGGSRVNNAGILSRGNEIEKLHEEVKKLEEKAGQKASEHKSSVEELAAAKADLVGAQADLTVAQEDKIRAESERNIVLEQIKTAQSALDELTVEKDTAIKRIESQNQSALKSEKTIKELTEQISKVEEELSNLTGNRESLTAKREELSRQASQINLEILAAKKDIEANQENIENLKTRKTIHEGRAEELISEIEQTVSKNKEFEQQILELTNNAQQLREQGQNSTQKIEELIEQRKELEAQSSKLRILERAKTSEREKLSGELARLEERKASMLKEYDETVNKLYDEYQLTRREAESMSSPVEEPAKAQRELNEIKNKIRALGSVNVGAIEEYKEVSERYEFLKAQIEDIEKSRDELTKLIEELTSNMAVKFREQFDKINSAFGTTFVELFGGGSAELILDDETDILECSISIKVQPPGKNVQNIDLLSGGEKGLAAIALLFAILKITPAPFCIFDEVEAALDDVNVTRYAKYVRRMTKNTQFILITHRRGTMEESDMMYGVTMQEEGVSKLLELNTAEMVKKLGIA